jgi:hypothetical protein
VDALCRGGKPQKGRRIVLKIDHIIIVIIIFPNDKKVGRWKTNWAKKHAKRILSSKNRKTSSLFRAALGGGTLRNHISFVDLLSFWLARASVPHRGGNKIGSNRKINPRKKETDPSNTKRADKTKRRKRHLKEPARLKTPKEGSTTGRKREREERNHIAEASKPSHRPARTCSAGSAPDAGIDSEPRGQNPPGDHPRPPDRWSLSEHNT